MLDVNRLRVIDAVARHGSVTAAAKELHYAQPSVTHHLARLEAETGAQLLQRVGRGIRLTPAGQLLADRAAEILGRIDAANAELSAHVGLSAGRVRLAAFASAIGALVPQAVAALAGRYPGLQISLTDTHPPEAIELLRAGLGLQPRDVMGDRRLGVVQLLRRPGDRAVARDGVDDPQPVDIQHASTLSMSQHESCHWTYEPPARKLKA